MRISENADAGRFHAALIQTRKKKKIQQFMETRGV
jgi:hypothetical protein